MYLLKVMKRDLKEQDGMYYSDELLDEWFNKFPERFCVRVHFWTFDTYEEALKAKEEHFANSADWMKAAIYECNCITEFSEDTKYNCDFSIKDNSYAVSKVA